MLLHLEGVIQRHALHASVLRLCVHGLGQIDALLHQLAVRRDVQIPLAELVHLALLLAHHHRHAGLVHPANRSEEHTSELQSH